MNDKSKPTLVCGKANSVRSCCLSSILSHSSCALCDKRPQKQTRSDTISCSTHSCGFHIISEKRASMEQFDNTTNPHL